MPDNFRVQFSRGTSAQANSYVGQEGELFIDEEAGNVRVMDGVNAGGGFTVGAGAGVDTVKVQVTDFASGSISATGSTTVSKVYSDSSLQIVHGKGKYPINWFGINKESNPSTGIYPTATTNIQLVDLNTVIITNIKDFNIAEYNLIF